MKKLYLIIFFFTIIFQFCEQEKSQPLDLSSLISIPFTNPVRFSGQEVELSGKIDCGYGITVLDYGHCWDTLHNPTTNNQKTGFGKKTVIDSIHYTSGINGLKPGKTYYTRAYFVIGDDEIFYSTELSFTTPSDILPNVNTKVMSDISLNFAIGGGLVRKNGGAAVIKRGICWNTTGSPDINDYVVQKGSGTGDFTAKINGLRNGRTYYVRAWATNENGTGYGEEVKFSINKAKLLGLEMVRVTGGTFRMGSNTGGIDEIPVHTVSLDSFEISKKEITNAQYILFLNSIGCSSDGWYKGHELIDIDDSDCAIGHNGTVFYFKGCNYADCPDCPVIEVSWYGALVFCEWVGGRLPYEVEWEFAASGGNMSRGYPYSGAENIDNTAWYGENSNSMTHPVGTKSPNELGIYDMSGNVWEWCMDWYLSDYYSNSPPDNPRGPSTGSYRVLRGGCWYNDVYYCRVSNRLITYPDGENFNIGFRVARDWVRM